MHHSCKALGGAYGVLRSLLRLGQPSMGGGREWGILLRGGRCFRVPKKTRKAKMQAFLIRRRCIVGLPTQGWFHVKVKLQDRDIFYCLWGIPCVVSACPRRVSGRLALARVVKKPHIRIRYHQVRYPAAGCYFQLFAGLRGRPSARGMQRSARLPALCVQGGIRESGVPLRICVGMANVLRGPARCRGGHKKGRKPIRW